MKFRTPRSVLVIPNVTKSCQILGRAPRKVSTRRDHSTPNSTNMESRSHDSLKLRLRTVTMAFFVVPIGGNQTMQVFLVTVGIMILLLIIYAAFNFGRQIESDTQARADAFAKACITEYQNHITNTYYVSESQRRWMSSMTVPQFPSVPSINHDRNRRVTQYVPSEDPAFVQNYRENGQATVWLNGGERAS